MDTVDVTIVEKSASTAFIIIFRDRDEYNHYQFSFYDNGYYSLFARKDGKGIWIQDSTESDGTFTLYKGLKNSFALLAKGPSFTLYANGQELTTVYDTTFNRAGNIGLGISLFEPNQSVTVDFDNLVIKEAP